MESKTHPHTCTFTHTHTNNTHMHNTQQGKRIKSGSRLTFSQLLASPHTLVCVCVRMLTGVCVFICTALKSSCLVTGRQSVAAAAAPPPLAATEVLESLGRPLKAHRVLGGGSPYSVKAFPCSSTQLCFSFAGSANSDSLNPHPNAEKTH